MPERNNLDNKEPKAKSTMGRAKIEEMEEKSEEINNLERLPEGCISDILSLTTPADVCRSNLLSSLIKSAADSDVIWEKFLPADYQDIISRSFYPFPSAAAPSKKELYYRLCNAPLLIDGGFKSFQLEKSGGKKCIMIGAKELDIAWGDDPNHWYWRFYPGSRFAEVAELKWSCWLEIRGKLETQLLSPKRFYAAYLVLKFKQDVYGFDDEPIKAKVEVVGRAGGNNGEERCIYLSPNGGKGQYVARKRGDGWMEVELGHFYNEELEDDEEVHISVLETESLGAKYGIIVQGMELRPKADTHQYCKTTVIHGKALYCK
ncbi:putative F-box protein PP2-B12 [Papaver somniferum]|uniref:putative F-box protein PP2-B12 n=1 Tax=Papaver somniferum TaxID=3469 RepID=UPI000E6F96DD|nr:putative F-box protein PP2-B12 [Papaver somniferum]